MKYLKPVCLYFREIADKVETDPANHDTSIDVLDNDIATSPEVFATPHSPVTVKVYASPVTGYFNGPDVSPAVADATVEHSERPTQDPVFQQRTHPSTKDALTKDIALDLLTGNSLDLTTVDALIYNKPDLHKQELTRTVPDLRHTSDQQLSTADLHLSTAVHTPVDGFSTEQQTVSDDIATIAESAIDLIIVNFNATESSDEIISQDNVKKRDISSISRTTAEHLQLYTGTAAEIATEPISRTTKEATTPLTAYS